MGNEGGNEIVIKTSQKGWITELAKAYKAKAQAVVFDDAKIGIDPKVDSLLRMGSKASLTPPEWTAVAIALGVAATGAYLVVMAILDPEPFSKLAFALGAGTTLVLGGGLSAIQVLTKQRPPSITLRPDGGIEIGWK